MAREEAVAAREGAVKRPCKYNVRISSIRVEELTLASVRTHLALYGRHPFYRKHTRLACTFPLSCCVIEAGDIHIGCTSSAGTLVVSADFWKFV